MAFILGSEKSTFSFLQNQNQQSLFREATTSALALAQIFGGRYVKQAIESLTEPVRTSIWNKVAQVQRVYIEIQQKLQSGCVVYQPSEFPRTCSFLKEFSYSEGHYQLFLNWKRRSFDMVPFLPLQTRPADPLIRQAREARSFGVNILDRMLQDRSYTPKEEERLAVVKVLCGAGAFIQKNRHVYLVELVQKWGGEEQVQQLKDRLGIPLNLLQNMPSVEEGPLAEKGESFPDFRIRSSLAFLESSLEARFSDSLKGYLRNLCRDEAIRSDLVGFFGQKSQISFRNWDYFQGESKPLLIDFEIYLRFDKRTDLSPKARGALLELCIRREDQRQSTFPAIKSGELQDALAATLKVSPDCQDPTGYSLLQFFLGQSKTKRDLLLELLGTLKRISGMRITSKAALNFFSENEGATSENCRLFVASYSEVIQKLQKIKPVENAETLFFVPPITLNGNAIKIGEASSRTDRLLRLVNGYSFEFKAPFLYMLREFISKPLEEFVSLLENSQAVLGIVTIDESLLARVFAEGVLPDHPASDLKKEEAKNWILELKQLNKFSDAEVFLLYIETIRVLTLKDGSLAPFRKVSEFVFLLKKELGLVLPPDVLYSLYRYHPQGFDPSHLKNVRDQFIQLSRQELLFDQIRLQEVLKQIHDTWVQAFEKSVFEDKERIISRAESVTCSVFFPPLQPLVDVCRISGVGVEPKDLGGAHWASSHLIGHSGQCKIIPGSAGVSAYCSWHLNRKRFPVLLIAFSDLTKRRTESVSLTLQISQQGISREGRGALFGALYDISQKMLASEERIEKLENYPLPPEELQEVIRFVSAAKIAYRQVCWKVIAGQHSESSPEESLIRIAALGNIAPPGSLLPHYLLKEQTEQSFYTAELETVEAHRLMACFKKCQNRQEILEIQLLVTDDGQTAIKKPLFFCARNIDQMIGSEEEEKKEEKVHWDERAPKKETTSGAYVAMGINCDELTKIQVIVHYPSEAFVDEEAFLSYYTFHILKVKAEWYAEFAEQHAKART